MGILNLTPDSFWDGGRFLSDEQVDIDAVLKSTEQMVNNGAALIDIGGESTRPGAQPVTQQQESDRVLPAIEAIAKRFDVVISVDTSCASLMQEAIVLGAGLINDVRALTNQGTLEVVAKHAVAVCLMHMQGEPHTMQAKPVYIDAVAEVYDFLNARVQVCLSQGITQNRILVDPGVGFGKSDDHNLALLSRLGHLKTLAPVLLGVSRKSIFGRLLGLSLQDRMSASVVTGLLALQQGVSILRVHDVAETQDAIKLWQMLMPDD